MIKIDIEMPKTCNGCFANQGSEDCCSLMSDIYPKNVVLDYSWNDTKPEWCPLIEEKGE